MKSVSLSDLGRPLFHRMNGNNDASNRAVMSIALAALSVVVAYFCLAHGLPMVDAATTSAQYVGSRILCYVGASFVLAATGNLVYMLCRDGVFAGAGGGQGYDMNDARRQAALTLTAPIAMIGLLAFGAISAVINGR